MTHSTKKRTKKTDVINVIPLSDTHRLTSVLTILMEIDKRIGHQQTKSKKAKKTNVAQGPLQRGSYFFFFWFFWFYIFRPKSYILKTVIMTADMIDTIKIKITKECAPYDRYYRFNIITRRVSYQ